MKKLLLSAALLSTSVMATPHVQVGNPNLEGLENVGYCVMLSTQMDNETLELGWARLLVNIQSHIEESQNFLIVYGSGYAKALLDSNQDSVKMAEQLYYSHGCEVVKENNL